MASPHLLEQKIGDPITIHEFESSPSYGGRYWEVTYPDKDNYRRGQSFPSIDTAVAFAYAIAERDALNVNIYTLAAYYKENDND